MALASCLLRVSVVTCAFRPVYVDIPHVRASQRQSTVQGSARSGQTRARSGERAAQLGRRREVAGPRLFLDPKPEA